MVLGFNKRFVEKILSGEKIHTIRTDKNRRWKIGNKIHFATGVRSKEYKEFLKGTCKGTQSIKIDPNTKTVVIEFNNHSLGIKVIENEDIVTSDNWIELQDFQIETLSKNDGFDTVEDFWTWFDKPFEGVLIHWTSWILYPFSN